MDFKVTQHELDIGKFRGACSADPQVTHASLVIESQFIICGGYGQGFTL